MLQTFSPLKLALSLQQLVYTLADKWSVHRTTGQSPLKVTPVMGIQRRSKTWGDHDNPGVDTLQGTLGGLFPSLRFSADQVVARTLSPEDGGKVSAAPTAAASQPDH